MHRVPVLLVVAVVGSCAGAPSSRGVSRTIEVRLARAGEFPRPECDWREGTKCSDARDSCAVEGDSAPELVDAVASFARTNLIREIDKLTGYRSGEVEISIEHLDERHADGFFTEVVVKPRTHLGELSVWQRDIFQGSSSWGADIKYCMHVTVGPRVISVVLERVTSMLG